MNGSLPAIAGAAEVVQRPPTDSCAADLCGPIELMAEAAREAARDAGVPALLGRVGWIGVVGGLWSYANPGSLVAERVGADPTGCALTAISGSAPQELVGLAAERIAAGEIDVALIVGGEARASTVRLRKLGREPSWTREPGAGEPERIGDFPEVVISEGAAIGGPAACYALFEDSLRAAEGLDVKAHLDRVARLWERFSSVAARNPNAWDQSPHTAAEIREPNPDNRMIAFPYPKAMVANNFVDMASALILCSVETARAAGVSTDRLVFPHVSVTSHETWRVAERNRLHEVPALAAGGHLALDAAGIVAGELDHVDLYACFPSIVQMSAAALGLGLGRPLTVTGGLGFAGAPIANSSGQAIAAMVPLLRGGGHGLVHANGGFATKHAFGVYAGEPPERFRRIDCEVEVEHRQRHAAPSDWDGSGEVEAATVVFDREGPSHAVAAIRTPDGGRGFVRSETPAVIDAVMTTGVAGEPAPLPGSETLT